MPSKIHADNYCHGDSSLIKFVKECEVCNLKLLTESCAILHKKICGKNGNLGYKCKDCNKFYSRNKKFLNATKFKEEHICGQKLCPTCKVYIAENNHICHMKKIYFVDDFESLAFLTMEFLYEPDGCITPNVISIFKETSPLSGSFDHYQISDFDDDIVMEEKTFNFPYFDQKITPSSQPKLSKEFKSKVFNIQKSTPKTCAEKLAKLITQWAATTIICRYEEGYIFDALIKSILRANVNVKVLTRSKKYFTVEIVESKIKIINIANYLPGPENEIAKLCNPNYIPRFFPYKFNLIKNYSLSGKIPEFDYFESQFEPKEISKQKVSFLENFKGIWVFETEIKHFSKEKSNLLCASTCLF